MPSDPLDFIDPNRATPDALIEGLIHITQQIKHYTGWKERLLTALTNQLDLGRVEPTTETNGYRFSYNPGRKTYIWPDSVIELEAKVMEAKETAVSTGRATAKEGKAFWSIREVGAGLM